MKRIKVIIAIFSFLAILGTAGSVDLGEMTFGHAVLRYIIFGAMFWASTGEGRE